MLYEIFPLSDYAFSFTLRSDVHEIKTKMMIKTGMYDRNLPIPLELYNPTEENVFSA